MPHEILKVFLPGCGGELCFLLFIAITTLNVGVVGKKT